MNVRPIRGDIFLAEMKQSRGSEQAGIRPVVIVQNNTGNKHSPTTIIVPLTAKKKRPLPTHVTIKHYGLKKKSIALCEQVTTIARSRLISYIGSLGAKDMKKLDKALKISLNIRKRSYNEINT